MSVSPNRKSQIANRKTEIAWEGWTLPVLPEWRPASVRGDRRRGRMLIGDAAQGVMLVQWWRPGEAGFDFNRWLRRRLMQVAGGARPDPNPPVPEGFSAAACLMDRTFDQGVMKSLWYGYAPGDDLVLELTINDAAETAARAVKREVLPSIGVLPQSGYTRWAVFGASFEAPPGHALVRKRLHAGDLALEFSGGKRRTLLVRQIYPAQAALARRTLERWVADPPFLERRRVAETTVDTAAALGGVGAGVGLCRRGWKRHAFPLGRFRPLRTCAIAAVDSAQDRILIAELTGGDTGAQGVVVRAVERMNG